jgi:propanol-preferring alcohol dehydrogenase
MYSKSNLSATVNEKTKGCSASAVLVAAGNGTAYQAALSIPPPFGTLICIGIPPPNQLVSFHPLTFIDKGVRIIGSAVGTRGDITETIAFVERGLVKPLILKTKLENLSDIAKEFGKV